MAINYELLNKGGISLGTNFELLSEKPLDSRLVVPSLEGLQNYIDNAAAYEGLIAYVSSEKKHYEVKVIDGVLSYRPFGLTEAELNDIITNSTTAAMEFKGATATLPENPAKGDMYKVAGENINIKIDDVDAKLGDSIVYDGEKWFLIPSGDDIEDTWRPVEGVNNDATIKFADGDKTVAAVAADGTIKYNHATVAAPEDITAEGDEKTRTYITAVETDGYGHITGYKTATENVVDTNTEYTFESQVESSSVYFNVTPNTEDATEETIYVDAYSKNEADGKFVAKETGKSLISDDEIARLAEVDNYDDEEIRGLIDAIDNHSHANKTVLDGITAEKVADWDDAVSKEHTHSFVDSDVEDAIAKRHTHTFADTDVEDAISKKHSHTFVEAELNKIADGDVAKWNDAYAHSQVAHAPADAQANVIESVKVNGAALEITDKAVDITIPESTKVEASETNGNIKVDGQEVTVYTHPEKHAIADVTGLQDALDGLQTKGNYAAEEHTHTKDEITDFEHTHTASEITDLDNTIKGYGYATKTELGDVDKKFANYKTAADQKAIDDEQDRRIGVLEGASETHATKDELAGVDAKFADYTKTADLPTDLGDFTNNAKYAKTADVEAELVKKADKSVVDAMYTNTQIDTAVQGAKDYAKGLVDAIPAQTDYTVTITEATDGLDAGIAKKYTFTQNGAEIGTINLAKELVVTAGSVKEVTEADAPYAGAKVGDKYIELVIANQDAPIYVPAKDLVDIYTAKDGAAEVQVAISNTNEISATLVNGGVTEEKLAEGVKTKLNKVWEEVGVAAGLVDGLENGQVKANKEAIEKLNGADTVDGSVAKSIKDAIEGENLGQYAKAADLGDLAVLDTITADKVTDFATEVAKVKVDEAVKADEATKAAQDGNGKVIADTYAEKATTLAGYGIGDAYTKTEIEALFTWGSF